ncbi:MAG: hypothetical protein MJH10_10160 [Epibacterium sp.]|nr:hypothetical protein [Epibacterium sp.]NQX73901.1 hypothetical protein [Epibacterium sp.]
MTQDTLPEGWTQEAHNAGWGENHYWTTNGDYGFDVQDKEEGIRIAHALSGPTIEDAKAAIEKQYQRWQSCEYTVHLSGMSKAFEILDNLSPTPAPDLTQNTTPFGLLPEATQEAFEALPKEAVQHWNGVRWVTKQTPQLAGAYTYRQNPDWTPKPLTKPAVPWDVLADHIFNAVKVEVGPNEWIVYGCTGTPEWVEDRQTWMASNANQMFSISAIMDIDPGTCHPRDSLVQRPKDDK